MVESLPHVNASLNGLATLLLIYGYVLIRSGKELAHKRAMLGAFLVSCIFLACYLVYHGNAGSKKFPTHDYGSTWYGVYLFILLPHIVLAATVPFLGIATIWLGLKIDLSSSSSDDTQEASEINAVRRRKHRKLARITFPIWVYVSITGVLVYLFLYWWFPPLTEFPIDTG